MRAANGISTVIEAIKLANSKHDILRYTSYSIQYLLSHIIPCSSLSDSDAFRFHISQQDKQDCVEEVNTELSVYFGILYFLIEVLKDSDGFAEELSKIDITYKLVSY